MSKDYFGGFEAGDVEAGSLHYFYLTNEELAEDFKAEGAIGWRADSTVMVEGIAYILTDDDLVEPRTSAGARDFDWLKD